MGMAFGILLAAKGYGVLWALGMSVCVYAGSLQFVGVGLLAGGFHPLQAALITLMVNARHVFYGVCLLEPFHALRKTKLYMIFALSDETFSLLCSAKPGTGRDVSPPCGQAGTGDCGPAASAPVDRSRFWLWIALLDQAYWVGGSIIGSLAGSALAFNPRGIDFVMTALFIVIFLQQWRTRGGRAPALLGIAAALLCLYVFGSRWFIVPAMTMILAALTAVWFRGKKLKTPSAGKA
jgi:predicted branched-subunit amino acid permease